MRTDAGSLPPAGITVVIPTIPPRKPLLERAVNSIMAQTLPVWDIIVMEDTGKLGAAATRERGLQRVRTPWVAFLDDDDYLYPEHIEKLTRHAMVTGADYVYSWFETCGKDPFPVHHFTDEWSNNRPIQTTITTLVRTRMAQAVGFLGDRPPTPDGFRSGEDWSFTCGCIDMGMKISHLAERTWHWCHHACGTGLHNTSGLPSW